MEDKEKRNQQSHINKRSNRPNKLSNTFSVLSLLYTRDSTTPKNLERRFKFICKEIDFNIPESRLFTLLNNDFLSP